MSSQIRILKRSSCPSLSGQSTLTYHIGCNTNSEILLRVKTNTGGGFFSQEWVPLKNILQILNICDKPFTWYVLYPLFEGKSVNTSGFLMAALKNEGLVKPAQRRYERMEFDCFMDMINKLMATQKRTNAQTSRKTVPA